MKEGLPWLGIFIVQDGCHLPRWQMAKADNILLKGSDGKPGNRVTGLLQALHSTPFQQQLSKGMSDPRVPANNLESYN